MLTSLCRWTLSGDALTAAELFQSLRRGHELGAPPRLVYQSPALGGAAVDSLGGENHPGRALARKRKLRGWASQPGIGRKTHLRHADLRVVGGNGEIAHVDQGGPP